MRKIGPRGHDALDRKRLNQRRISEHSGVNQDDLIERLWFEVFDPPSPNPDTIAATCLPSSADVARAVARILERGAAPVDVHQVLRERRQAAVFHAFVALEQDDPPEPDDLLDAALPRERVDDLLAENARLARMPFREGTPDPAAAALDRLVAHEVSHEDLELLFETTQRFAVHRLLALLTELTDPLEHPHESLQSSPGSAAWPREPAAPAPRRTDAPLLTVASSFHLAFTPDGAHIVNARGRVTEIASGNEMARCAVFANTSDVAVSPDGRWLAATNTSGRIALCDLATGARVWTLKAASEGAGAHFSPDGTALVATAWIGETRAWETATGAPIDPTSVPAAPADPYVDVSRFGPQTMAWLASVAWAPDRLVLVWATTVGFELRRADEALITTHAMPYATRATFSPDGRRVAFASWKRGEVWDLATLLARG